MSDDVQNVRKSLRELIKEATETYNTTCLPLDTPSSIMLDEIIDVDNINFKDDENWLYESSTKNSTVNDLKLWLYQDMSTLKDFDFHSNRLVLIRELARNDAKKSIDSRTFTRPKKRFNRPSIENLGYIKNDKIESEPSLNNSIVNVVETNKTFKVKDSISDTDVCYNTTIAQQPPLNFDYSELTTSSIFEKIVATASGDDTIQNMSPPSFVNSMSSSTFTNLMENSMIKEDSVLREISVTDYTEAMLQDYDPPLFKSITDSCSSINLDNPETFIKQNYDSTLNNVYKKNFSEYIDCSLKDNYIADKSDNMLLEETLVNEYSSDVSSTDVCYNNDTTVVVAKEQTKSIVSDKSSNLNGTYKKGANSKLNRTFLKMPLYHSNDNLNSTVTYTNDSNKFDSTKRHSYIVENHNDLNQTVTLNQNSFGFSAGSTDSLDYLSSLSSSSRDSNKMLNMAEVDALVLQQEQSLPRAMSTPKATNVMITRLWENGLSGVSAMKRGELSDTDSRSSNEDYQTVRSNISSIEDVPIESISNDSTNIMQNIPRKNDIASVDTKSLNVIKSELVSNNKILNIRGSNSNLKTVGTKLKGSYTNLKPSDANFKSNNVVVDNQGSNLKCMAANLKGSYTQLKPTLFNLPGTDNNLKLYNTGPTLYKSQPTVKIVKATSTLRDMSVKDQVQSIPASSIAKSQLKASGLPRPVSNIPRPTTSKIPTPRSRNTNVRQLSRPGSKNSLDNDF
ncbi:hypothetical protein RN001_003070 [Aquatica leii]|uniref:Uncharacterized protein n=1 Tax=Aquatica leii TaxID=1421715 RepID=A0AAN7SM45_9COLE|nr:hypothetical protein RN001_003070 [Aquatica leii]